MWEQREKHHLSIRQNQKKSTWELHRNTFRALNEVFSHVQQLVTLPLQHPFVCSILKSLAFLVTEQVSKHLILNAQFMRVLAAAVETKDLSKWAVHVVTQILSVITCQSKINQTLHIEPLIRSLISHCFSKETLSDCLWAVANLFHHSTDRAFLLSVLNKTQLETKILQILRNNSMSLEGEGEGECSSLLWFLSQYLAMIETEQGPVFHQTIGYLQGLFLGDVHRESGSREEMFTLLKVVLERFNLLNDPLWEQIVLDDLQSASMLQVVYLSLSLWEIPLAHNNLFHRLCDWMECEEEVALRYMFLQIVLLFIENSKCMWEDVEVLELRLPLIVELSKKREQEWALCQRVVARMLQFTSNLGLYVQFLEGVRGLGFYVDNIELTQEEETVVRHK